MKTRQKTISTTELKAGCLRILDELDPEGLVITKRGKPVAELRPIPSRLNARLIGCMKDRIRIRGDIFTTGIEWNAES